MSTSTVRIRPETRDVLRELASQTGHSMPDLLDEAVEALRRRRFLEGLAEDFATLHENPENWRDELEEREAWDSTLRDGLGGD